MTESKSKEWPSLSEWWNTPVNFPSWLGYLLIAVLACFLNTFILINVFKSVGVQNQFIEARSQIQDIQGSINPINTRLTELEKKLSEPQKLPDRNRFILF